MKKPIIELPIPDERFIADSALLSFTLYIKIYNKCQHSTALNIGQRYADIFSCNVELDHRGCITHLSPDAEMVDELKMINF